VGFLQLQGGEEYIHFTKCTQEEAELSYRLVSDSSDQRVPANCPKIARCDLDAKIVGNSMDSKVSFFQQQTEQGYKVAMRSSLTILKPLIFTVPLSALLATYYFWIFLSRLLAGSIR
jgi:hypothetical protein